MNFAKRNDLFLSSDMNPRLLLLSILLMSTGSFAQREMKPKSVQPLDLSAEGERKSIAEVAAWQKISDKIEKGFKEENLSPEEKKLWERDFELEGDYWATIGNGCSWYCGGEIRKFEASSSLKSQGANTYVVRNAHDFSLKTAWVEGVKGYGIGEYIEYTFPPECPRITEVIIANGYVKSEQAYRDNSRVRKLKMYFNGKPFAILNLEDKRSLQRFEFDPIGNSDRSDFEALKKQPSWSLRFEILEVYQGARYDDVVISELYFDGIDVH